MKLSSLKQKNKKLLKLSPGSYFKVEENEAFFLKESKTGLVVSSYTDTTTGNSVYNIVLVDGELLLVPDKDPCQEISKK